MNEQESSTKAEVYQQKLVNLSPEKWFEVERYLEFASEYGKSKSELTPHEIVLISKYSSKGFSRNEIKETFGIDCTNDKKRNCLKICVNAWDSIELAGRGDKINEVTERFVHFPQIKGVLNHKMIAHIVQNNPHYAFLLEKLSEGLSPITIAREFTNIDLSDEAIPFLLRKLSSDFLKSFARGEEPVRIGKKLARAILFTEFLNQNNKSQNVSIVKNISNVIKVKSSPFDLTDFRVALANVDLYDAILQNKSLESGSSNSSSYLIQLKQANKIPYLVSKLMHIVASYGSYQPIIETLTQQTTYKRQSMEIQIYGLVRFIENSLLYKTTTGNFTKRIAENRSDEMQEIAQFITKQTRIRLGIEES